MLNRIILMFITTQLFNPFQFIFTNVFLVYTLFGSSGYCSNNRETNKEELRNECLRGK